MGTRDETSGGPLAKDNNQDGIHPSDEGTEVTYHNI